MSGIVGIYYLNKQPADRSALKKMANTQAHRGPDGVNVWHAREEIGLGHQMLWTTPESLSEELPLVRGSHAITADARVDNREELLVELGLKGYPTREISDSAIILAAYEKWGTHCPEKILGDFAFAIWDRRRQILFCARDYFGVKPFYYYHRPGHIYAFASEIKALLCLSGVPHCLNEVRIGDYLAMIPEDKNITFYQDILRLPPAHAASVSPENFQLRQFWSMDPNREIRLSSSQEYADAYLDVFSTAVRCRLRSAFPIGSALSGGLDSSSIVCVARGLEHQIGGKPLKTFSGIFDTVPVSDERPYIDAVVQQGNVHPRYVRVDEISPLVDLERVLWHQDEPIWAPNLFMHWGLYDAALDEGVRVFLCGFLGDNVVCHGWEHLMDVAYDWHWISLFEQINGLAKRKPHYSRNKMMLQYLWQCSLKPRATQLLRLALRQPSRSKGTLIRIDPIINPDFARRVDLQDRLQVLRSPSPSPPGAARQRQHRDLTAGEIPLGLEAANKLSSAFSVESRYPFSDRRLAEFCLALPSVERVRDGLSRMIVRRALKNHLPDMIIQRSGKGDLSHNLRHALLKFEEQRLDALILDNTALIEPYLDVPTLRSRYHQYKKDPARGDIQAVWSAANLALWLQQPPL